MKKNFVVTIKVNISAEITDNDTIDLTFMERALQKEVTFKSPNWDIIGWMDEKGE